MVPIRVLRCVLLAFRLRCVVATDTQALDDACKNKDISEDKCKLLKSKYSAVHTALIKLIDNDKKLMAKAKTLNTQLN
eukprot:6620814-Pyramimonas_sp.AAC.1